MKMNFKMLLVTCIFGLFQQIAWSNSIDEAKELCDEKFENKINQFDNMDLKKFFIGKVISFENSQSLPSLIFNFNQNFIKQFQRELNITPGAPLSSESFFESLQIVESNNGKEKITFKTFEKQLNIPELINEEGVKLVLSISHSVLGLDPLDGMNYSLIKEFGTYLENESSLSVSDYDFLGRVTGKRLTCKYTAYQDTNLLKKTLVTYISVRNSLTGRTIFSDRYKYQIKNDYKSDAVIPVIFEEFDL